MIMPDNKLQIFYDREAGHYRVILDGHDLSLSLATGGVKVDFSNTDAWGHPEVTLKLYATGGLEVVLADGTTLDQPAPSDPNMLCDGRNLAGGLA